MYSAEGVSQTITARTHGDGMGNILEIKALRYERTDYAKKIRKAYEAHKLNERRCNMRQYGIRTDGCSNTITTVTKDNYLIEYRL